MTKRPTKQVVEAAEDTPSEQANLARFLSQKAKFNKFELWVVGDTPLLCHSWSEKARLEMLQKQTGATRPSKAPRNPEQDFVIALSGR